LARCVTCQERPYNTEWVALWCLGSHVTCPSSGTLYRSLRLDCDELNIESHFDWWFFCEWSVLSANRELASSLCRRVWRYRKLNYQSRGSQQAAGGSHSACLYVL
jgi:hypothetical protein